MTLPTPRLWPPDSGPVGFCPKPPVGGLLWQQPQETNTGVARGTVFLYRLAALTVTVLLIS